MNRMAISLMFVAVGIGAAAGGALAQMGDTNVADRSLDSLLSIEISTAAKYAQTSQEAPATVTIVTSEEIERYGFHTLEDVLATVRGFYISNDRNYSYVGVRGFSRPTDYNNRILLLLNGHSLNENVYGSAFIGTDLALDLDLIDRIEIVRGPGSALYGTNAMFAVINLITKTGNGVDGLTISGEGGSYGRRRGGAIFGKRFASGLDLSVSGLWGDVDGQRLYYKEYDALATNHGIAEHLDWDRYSSGMATAAWKRFTLQGCTSVRRKGIPTGAWGIDFDNDDAMTLDRRAFVELRFSDSWSADKHVMVRGYYDHCGYCGTYPFDGQDLIETTNGRWFGTEGQFGWDLRTDDRLTLGVEYQRHPGADYHASTPDSVYSDASFPYRLASIYVQNELQLTRDLSFTAGVRWDDHSTVGSSTTPRAALVFSPHQWGTYKLLYGEAFRAPNIYETHGTGDVLKGNPGLKPERIRTVEVAWEQRLTPELWGTASFYRYVMEDLIDQTIDPADSLLQYRNISRAEAEGIELELDTRLRSGVDGYISYTLEDTNDPVLHEDLSNCPHHLVRMGVTCDLRRYLEVAVRGQYESARTTIYRTKTDPYSLAGVGVVLKPRHQTGSGTGALFNHLAVSLWINNLFDVTYRTPGGVEHRQPALAQNGRNFVMKLQYEL